MWLRGVLKGHRMERDMQAEMAGHIARAAERFRARGMPEHEALLAARREFGHLGAVENEARALRGGQWLSSFAGDLRYALRYFVRTPLTTITIVLTLALGIGFSSAVFSVLNGILRRPAPGVPNEANLVKIRGLTDRAPFTRSVSWPELQAYAALSDRFTAVAGWVNSTVVIETEADAGGRNVAAQFVTPNFFGTLGVHPSVGRSFGPVPAEGDADLSAIVSDALATQQFGDAQSALGQRLLVNGLAVTIVGVTEPRFHGAVPTGRFHMIWLPLSSWHLVERGSRELLGNVTAARFEAFARLRPGLTAAAATPAVQVVAARVDSDARALAAVPPAWSGTADVVRMRGIELANKYGSDLPIGVVVASTIALLILLVCTTTVNSLLVGAAAARRHEIGVRLALGASRSRIVRQLLTEVAILATLAGLLGMWAFGALTQLAEVTQDGFDVSPDWLTVSFVLLYALATATLSGLSPALHATRADLAHALKDSQGGSRKSRLQRTFVVAQIAVAQPLMVALAAVIVDQFILVRPTPADPLRERLLVAELSTYVSSARGEPDRVPGLMGRLSAMPGVEAVVPLGYSIAPLSLVPPEPADSGAPARFVQATQQWVRPGYLAAVNATLLQGRDFVPADTVPTVTPTIISEALAAALFPSGGAMGRRIRWRRPGMSEPAEMEVIGVVGGVDYAAMGGGPPMDWPALFVPLRESGAAHLLIRTSGPAEALMPAVLAAARAETRLMPVSRLYTMAQTDRSERERQIQVAGALSGMGTLALLLASVGLYAMVRMAVEQRRREIGIRMALGADARQVVRHFFRDGLRATLLGLAIGLPVSVVALTVIELGTFMGHIPLAGAGVAAAVLGVAALASWLPARRASRVDAMVVLRSE